MNTTDWEEIFCGLNDKADPTIELVVLNITREMTTYIWSELETIKLATSDRN